MVSGREEPGVNRSADVVVIGAGILGCAVGFELSKRGHDVIVVDKLPAAGHGSTSNSSAIVRFDHSTFDGVALAHESARAWFDWPAYCGVEDELGFAEYIRCGSLILQPASRDHSEYRTHFATRSWTSSNWLGDFRTSISVTTDRPEPRMTPSSIGRRSASWQVPSSPPMPGTCRTHNSRPTT